MPEKFRTRLRRERLWRKTCRKRHHNRPHYDRPTPPLLRPMGQLLTPVSGRAFLQFKTRGGVVTLAKEAWVQFDEAVIVAARSFTALTLALADVKLPENMKCF